MNSTDELRMQRADAVFALAPVIPVITIDDLEDALPMARALVDNGLKVLEVTLRTPVALDAIERIATEVPDACVGAGTVLDLVGLKASIRAGARFAISPGATEALYDTAQYADIPLIPGIATASELMRGLERGWRRFKFFPAEASGGIVPRFIPFLRSSAFRERFLAKGRLAASLESIPIHVITHPNPGLLGAATALRAKEF